MEAHTSADISRQSADFHPSVWGDFFLTRFPSSQTNTAFLKLKRDELKVEVQKMLLDTTESLQALELINRIQCLGLAYHFEKEIEVIIHNVNNSGIDFDNLYMVALYFRLLRQQKYHVSCDIFNKFLDESGEFAACWSYDANVLLCLYEAAHYYEPNEEILDKALKFSKSHLKSLSVNNDSHLSMMIASSLDIPLARRVNRVKAKLYLSIFQNDKTCNVALLNLAKLDFTLLQEEHQDEARCLTVWWNDLALVKSLPFIRDRMLECYFWMLSTFFESCYSTARMMTSKVLTMISILDDIYDTYGTIEELQLLTDVIDRWELTNIEKLPQYMQHCIRTMFYTYQEFESELENQQYSFRVKYLINEFKHLTKAYLQEAKWANDGYVPTLKEYLSVSTITCAYLVVTCASYLGIKNEISKEVFETVTSMPQIMKSCCFICRVMNDIQSYKHEQKRKHVASAVQCYVMEFGCSEKEACKKLMELVEEEWKILNQEFVHSNLPAPLLQIIINLSNFLVMAYKDMDAYTNSKDIMKDNITAVLVDHIQI